MLNVFKNDYYQLGAKFFTKSVYSLITLGLLFSAQANANNGQQQNKASHKEIYHKNTIQVSTSQNEMTKSNVWKQFGSVYDQFNGVPAFSNTRGGKYQCTELVHRFLSSTFNVPTRIGIGLGDAKDLNKRLVQRFSAKSYNHNNLKVKMTYYENHAAQEPPAVGSPINFEVGQFGHIAIVRYVLIISESQVRAYLIEQHGFPKWKVGDVKPIRFVAFKKTEKGAWGAEKSQLGTPISWINFKASQN